MHQISLLANNFKFLGQIYPEKVNIITEFRRFLIQILIFWTKYAQKGISSQNRKSEIIIEFFIFKLALEPNFSLNWQFWFFWLDLPRKGFSGLEQKKWTPYIFCIILHIKNTKFQLKLTIFIFWIKFSQKYIPSWKQKKWISP